MDINIVEFEKRLRESELTELEAYFHGTGEAPVLYKAYGLMEKTVHGEPLTFVASEESEDRLGDIIEVNGWELGNFKNNPVFMFLHQHNIPPIGVVSKVWKQAKQLMATVRFDDADPLAQFVKGKYEREIMRAVSVGFRPIEFVKKVASVVSKLKIIALGVVVLKYLSNVVNCSLLIIV